MVRTRSGTAGVGLMKVEDEIYDSSQVTTRVLEL
jgi:hypothetical protein